MLMLMAMVYSFQECSVTTALLDNDKQQQNIINNKNPPKFIENQQWVMKTVLTYTQENTVLKIAIMNKIILFLPTAQPSHKFSVSSKAGKTNVGSS